MDVSSLSKLFTTTVFELIIYLNLLNNYDKSKHGRWHLKKLVRKVKIRRSYVLNLFEVTCSYLNLRNPKRKNCHHEVLNDIYLVMISANSLPHIYNRRMKKIERKEMKKEWYKETNFSEKRAILRKKDKEEYALHCIDINF